MRSLLSKTLFGCFGLAKTQLLVELCGHKALRFVVRKIHLWFWHRRVKKLRKASKTRRPPTSRQSESRRRWSRRQYLHDLGPSICPSLNDPQDDERCSESCHDTRPSPAASDNYCYCGGRCQWMLDEETARYCVCSNRSCKCKTHFWSILCATPNIVVFFGRSRCSVYLMKSRLNEFKDARGWTSQHMSWRQHMGM